MSIGVWSETRRNKHGINYLIRWEINPKGDDGKALKDENGRRIRTTGSEMVGPSKIHRDTRLQEIREKLFAGQLQIKPKTRFTSVPAFVDEYLANSKSTKSAGTHREFDERALKHFEDWFGNKPLTAIEPETLSAWRDALAKSGRRFHPRRKNKDHLPKTLSPTTVHMRLRALRTALSYGVERGYLPENPFKRIRASTLFPPVDTTARYLSHEEVRKLLGEMPPHVAQAVYFILHTGLRHSELLNLDWKMIHKPQDGLWTAEITRASAHGLETGYRTKTRKSRIIELDQKVTGLDVLGEPRSEGKVFPWQTQNVIMPALREAAESLKLGRIRLHDFRHTWATNFMHRSGNIFELMYRGGWSSMNSAGIYQHIRRRDEPVDYWPLPHYCHTKTDIQANSKPLLSVA